MTSKKLQPVSVWRTYSDAREVVWVFNLDGAGVVLTWHGIRTRDINGQWEIAESPASLSDVQIPEGVKQEAVVRFQQQIVFLGAS